MRWTKKKYFEAIATLEIIQQEMDVVYFSPTFNELSSCGIKDENNYVALMAGMIQLAIRDYFNGYFLLDNIESFVSVRDKSKYGERRSIFTSTMGIKYKELEECYMSAFDFIFEGTMDRYLLIAGLEGIGDKIRKDVGKCRSKLTLAVDRRIKDTGTFTILVKRAESRASRSKSCTASLAVSSVN